MIHTHTDTHTHTHTHACMFKADLSHIVNSKLAWVTRAIVSKKKKKEERENSGRENSAHRADPTFCTLALKSLGQCSV